MKNDEEWRTRWSAMLEQAHRRPAMFIGGPASAHTHFLISAVRLGWKAAVVQAPRGLVIDLSPHQYVVRVVSGPLIPEIQSMYQWGAGRTLDETWQDDSRRYFERLDEEDAALPFEQKRWRRTPWRYCFAGPIGPRLNEPSGARVFARHLYWGVQTDAGLWCEGYDNGWPISHPVLLPDHNGIGIFAAAHLAPDCFTGLPFKPDDVQRLLTPPMPWYGGDNIKCWTPPSDITVRWHDVDDIDLRGPVETVFASLL